jgi:phage terminase large subunit-like protein
MADPDTIVIRGTTYDNLDNLSPTYRSVIRSLEGTRLGRQELNAEILTDVPGALWTYDVIDSTRVTAIPHGVHHLQVVVGVDPSGTDPDDEDDNTAAAGIIVSAKGSDGRGYVLADKTLKDSPEAWARAAVNAYHLFSADRIVAEANYGGAMVRATIHAVDPSVPVTIVHASRGKAVRAEPISTRYERGQISHVGTHPELEDEMCDYAPGAKSPNRMDALVWSLTNLFGTEAVDLDELESEIDSRNEAPNTILAELTSSKEVLYATGDY